jgi:hypothetical protein
VKGGVKPRGRASASAQLARNSSPCSTTSLLQSPRHQVPLCPRHRGWGEPDAVVARVSLDGYHPLLAVVFVESTFRVRFRLAQSGQQHARRHGDDADRQPELHSTNARSQRSPQANPRATDWRRIFILWTLMSEAETVAGAGEAPATSLSGIKERSSYWAR